MISFFKKLQSRREAKEQLQRQQLTQDIKQEIENFNKIWIEDGKKYNYEPALYPTDDEHISRQVNYMIRWGISFFTELSKCIGIDNQERRRLAVANELCLYSLNNEYEIQLKG
jgi:hypothetical protein